VLAGEKLEVALRRLAGELLGERGDRGARQQGRIAGSGRRDHRRRGGEGDRGETGDERGEQQREARRHEGSLETAF
jgi:hypothetical protein